MDRKTKILMKALSIKDEATMTALHIPKYETKGLDIRDREILLTDSHKLFINELSGGEERPEQDEPLHEQEPLRQHYPSWCSDDESAAEQLQCPSVSSTEKSYSYRTRFAVKRRLFSESGNEDKKTESYNVNPTSTAPAVSGVTSSVDQQSPLDPYVSSEDEYVPDSADESSSSDDSNSTIVIPKIPQIVIERSNMQPIYDQNVSEQCAMQQNMNKQGIRSQNISKQHFQEVAPNNKSIKIHQNLILKEANPMQPNMNKQSIRSQNISKQHFQEVTPNNESIQIDQNVILQELNTKKQTTKRKRAWNKRDYCFFCDTEVLKFSRHVLRHHEQEIEVQQILAYNVRDKKRKALFNKLRNQGNFLKSTTVNNNIVPVRQPIMNNSVMDAPSVSTYLPCKYCKGFYKRKYLYRHVKKCPHNDNKSMRINAQSEGQSLFATYKENDLLRNNVFPIMRADEISYTAKTDPLICAVARRYLKSHPDKQFRLVTSRKMRQLAALLIEIKKVKPVKNLLQALDPANFEIIVESTKIIAKFDAKSSTYGAPSLASHMGTELKDCIDVGYNMSLKLHHRETEETAKLKALRELVTTEWRYEVSTIANNDLQQKKWNKPTLVPLAEDLVLVKKYLLAEAEKLRNDLKQNPNHIKAFKTLQEICYVQLLLLNRRRIGELQRMTVHSYTSNINNESSTEFDNCISESERVLLRSFKRVIIKGKRGRGVPVLFTEEIVRTTNLLLKVRANFVQDGNIYLFANTKSSNSISGSTAVYTHVRRAGAKNPAALTSTKLRKHLATMSQVVNLSEQDLEQLASFMGHTSEIHKSCYRLPNDLYQIAKVSKLLILNERGEASKYKGKTLDEIDIDLNAVEEENSDEDDDREKNNDNNQQQSMAETLDENICINLPEKEKPATSKQKYKRILEPWTNEQKRITLAFFKDHLKKHIPPKKHECLQLQEENPGVLNNKSWPKIKIFVVNNYVKK